MARVTVEDCAEVVENRFELVALASQRAKNISSGAPLAVNRDNDKDAVVALREIAAKVIDTQKLKDTLITSCQEKVRLDGYGVEHIDEDKPKFDEDNAAAEIEDEMKALQAEIDADDDELLYGGDDIAGDD